MARKLHRSLYDVLGVKPNATEEEIKKAFRERARETHPDRKGDDEEFREVAHAYGVISDPKKRKRYDETKDDKPLTMEEVLVKAFCETVMKAFQSGEDPEFDYNNIVSATLGRLRAQLHDTRTSLTGIEMVLSKLPKIRRKIKGDPRSVLRKSIDQEIDMAKETKEKQLELAKLIEEAMAYLRTCDYETLKRQSDTFYLHPGSWRT